MAETLGCPYAVDEKGVVRCGVLKALEIAKLKISQMDYALTPHSLAFAGGGSNTHCGIDDATRRTSCIGSRVSKDRLPYLMNAVREGTVLIHPENAVVRARIFDASVDGTFFKG